MPDLMFDTNQDARPLIGNLGLVGCVAVARYLFAGATDAQGNVPQPVATPLTADEAQAILAAGLAILPVDNGRVPGCGVICGTPSGQLYLHGRAEGDFDLALRALLGEEAPLSARTVARLKPAEGAGRAARPAG